MGDELEEFPENDEPNRPPYRCGGFNAKFMQAVKTKEYFNRARTSLDSVWSLFEEHKDEHPQIPILLETYKNIREEYHENLCYAKNYPLIVFEGLDGSGKSTVGKLFAKKIGTEVMPTPPKALSAFRAEFDGDHCWHAPFYYFGNYVAAMEVANILKSKPVVMDRFWHSTTSFALAQMKEDFYKVMKSTELPERGNDIYEWPKDLLKPDIVIFLDVSEEVRKNRLSRRFTKTDQENLLESKQEFRKNVLLAYENMANPGICKIDGNSSLETVLQEIDNKVKNLF
ncbi:UMP-CMP kinase 2, mitochondrial-like isoform X2 [Coccinella septempunctata]|uniref:UMP-CMP kinase 2, mitochondrial-like isoform X2 n=1 Tax=Coccinella septempunctata TaxID=41139 RepID=UPI001D08B9D5|nr:UMP-CMP kinase 2, mitochondrial-like isoform X2 [Coccinella septempunctata]